MSAKNDILESPLYNVDWALLRDQKEELKSRLNGDDDPLFGILHFIDDIQDYAVDVLGFSEDTIFGKCFEDE
jgi:hypothetical protein